jgi:hypothetical protein
VTLSMRSVKREFPRMCLPLDFRWSDFEWEFPAIKLPKGWKNRQLKRLRRIGQQIADNDQRFLEAEREKLRLLGLEIQRELELQTERDRRLEQFQQAVEEAERFSESDNADTQKYLEQIAQMVERRRKRDAEWKAQAEARLRKSDEEFNAVSVRLERNELLRRGVLKGRGPKPVTPLTMP